MKACSYGKMQLGFEPLLIFILGLFFHKRSILCDTDDNSRVARQLHAWSLFTRTEKPSLITHIGKTEVW